MRTLGIIGIVFLASTGAAIAGPHSEGAVRDHRSPAPAAGVVRTYHAPVIRAHYYNYYRRPALIVETFEPVPGYAWIHGDWRWSGAEWLWVPGYWAVAAAPVSVGATVVIH